MKTGKINKKQQKREKQQLKKQVNKTSSTMRTIKPDQRFAKASYDPKFMTPSLKETKIKIDKRFSKMMTDPSFKISGKVDKYGRSIKHEQTNKELEDYYYLDQNENDENKEQLEDQEELENQVELNDQQEAESQQKAESQQEAEDFSLDQNQEVENIQSKEQEDGIKKWMQEYDEKSSDDEDIPMEQLLDDEEDQIWSDDENVIKNQNVQATKRLALCNYDWMNINAKDLMILFSSFKPSSGLIKNVKVYLSLIGKEKLEQQNLRGPQGIWNEEDVNTAHNHNQPKSKKEEKKSWKKLLQNNSGNHKSDVLDDLKLRKYEKQRLKYYFAIIECDSKKTADEIYRECDGNQFQNSNLPFDLRFVPDDTPFEKSMLKQQCNQLSLTGEVKNFVNRALGHSKVNLTWEDPELSLSASLKKKNWNRLTEDQIDKIDWGMYINQDDVEEEDQMRELIGDQHNQDDRIPDWKKQNDKKYRKKDDIQITFGSGFDVKSEAKNEFQSLKKQKKSLKEKRREVELSKNKQRQQLQLLVDDKKDINFKVNLQDPRFKAVYDNPLYSIDPVDPKFDHRKSGKVFEEIVKRNKKKNIE